MLYVSILYYFLLLSSIPLCQYIIIFLFIGWWTLVLSIVNRTDLHTYVFVRTYASITLGQNTKVVLLDFMVSVCFIKKKKNNGTNAFSNHWNIVDCIMVAVNSINHIWAFQRHHGVILLTFLWYAMMLESFKCIVHSYIIFIQFLWCQFYFIF